MRSRSNVLALLSLNFMKNPSKMYLSTIAAYLLFLIQLLGSIGQEIRPEKPTKLTSRNYHVILSLEDPWIVVFIEDYAEKESELVALATLVVGMVQVGFVDMDDTDCDEIVEAKRITGPQIRVYEYGEENKEKPKRAKTYKEAVEIALESYPDKFERITQATIPSFYSQAMKEQKPRKLPVIYLSETDRVVPVLRYFAITLKDLFAFGVLVNPSPELMGNLSINALPHLMVLSHLNLKTGSFEMIKYDDRAFGPYNVANVLKFLLGVQNEAGDKKHRKTMEMLLGNQGDERSTRKNQPGVEELTYSSIERICNAKSSAICVVAFLGNGDKDYIKNKEAVLDSVRKSEKLRDHHIRYSWINATCHENIAEAFDVDLTQLPYVIALKRSENQFTNHVGSLSYEDLREFLFTVLSKRKPMVSYDKFPRWMTKDCNLIKTKCNGGICHDAKKTKKNRGPKLSGGGSSKSEL